MSDEVQLKESSLGTGTTSSNEVPVDVPKAGEAAKKGWLKGMLPAICCGAPLLLVAAITLFGVSLGAIASGLLTLGAVLACPLGMYFMMRMMNKK